MRSLGIGIGVFLLGLGCSVGPLDDEQGLAPTAHAPPPAFALGDWAGRWEAVTERDGALVISTPCDGESPFVEIRTDGEGGWELLAGGDGLQVSSVTSVEPTPTGIRLVLAGEAPVEAQRLPAEAPETDGLATFTPLFGTERFASPARRGTLPKETQPAAACAGEREEP